MTNVHILGNMEIDEVISLKFEGRQKEGGPVKILGHFKINQNSDNQQNTIEQIKEYKLHGELITKLYLRMLTGQIVLLENAVFIKSNNQKYVDVSEVEITELGPNPKDLYIKNVVVVEFFATGIYIGDKVLTK